MSYATFKALLVLADEQGVELKTIADLKRFADSIISNMQSVVNNEC